MAHTKTPDFEKLGELYQVHARTVRRWHSAGCDVNDLEAVATHLITRRSAKPEALAAVESRLQSKLNSHV